MKKAITVITGEIRQGKTTFALNLLSLLREKNLKAEGILCIGTDAEGIRTGFNLFNILSEETIPLCTTTYRENYLNFGRYYFDPMAFQQGNKWLNECLDHDPDVVFIDEIGPLELQGEGWSPALSNLLEKCPAAQVWIIRRQLVKQVLSFWKAEESKIFDISSDETGSVLDYLKTLISRENT